MQGGSPEVVGFFDDKTFSVQYVCIDTATDPISQLRNDVKFLAEATPLAGCCATPLPPGTPRFCLTASSTPTAWPSPL